jgi:hypothetical protein
LIKRHILRACCGGSKAYVFELPRGISANDKQAFIDDGFSAPPHFEKAGLFHMAKQGITVSGHFGNKNLQVRANGPHTNQYLDALETLLLKITS